MLLGISLSDWEIINSFSNWLSAIGTLAAVIVSLWLASRAGKLRARTAVGHRIIVSPGDNAPHPEVISFKLVNTGDRTIVVTGIGWRVGLWGRRYAVQIHDHLQSSKMPIELSHGQEANWLVPLNARGDEDPWLKYFSIKMLMPNWRSSCFTLRAQFVTSIGETFNVKPEKNLISRLRKECASISRASG